MMALPGRYFLGGQPLHVVQRAKNRQEIVSCDEDYRLYRDWLTQAAMQCILTKIAEAASETVSNSVANIPQTLILPTQ